MYCSNCGIKLPDEAKFCPECGQQIVNGNIVKSAEVSGEYVSSPQIEDKATPTFFGLKNNKNSFAPKRQRKKVKMGCLIPSIIFAVICFAFIVALLISMATNTPLTKTELSEIMELNEAQASDLLAIFTECGIDEIKSVELFRETESLDAYYVSDINVSDILVFLINDSRELYSIVFNDVTIYKVDDDIKGFLPDYYVSSEERTIYITASQTLVKNCLSYPETAKFSIVNWAVFVNNGRVICQSSVECKNAFGVELKIPFQVSFDKSTGDAVSLILDGQEYISQ